MSKLIISTQHIDFYNQEGFLELEEVIPSFLYDELRLNLLKAKSQRHLSRQLPVFKKLIQNRSLLSIALELSSKKFLRYGLDLLITSDYAELYKKPIYFRQLFSFTGIAMGLFINLSSEPTPKSSEPGALSLFPSNPRGATFFKATHALDFSLIHQHEKQLLILFCFMDSRYKLNPFDPFAHDVKKEDKSFGDKLSDKFHPLIYK